MTENTFKDSRTAAIGDTRSTSTPLDLVADLNARLAMLEADSMTSDALSVLEAHLALVAAQQLHSDTTLAAHLAYMAELRISIAETDARICAKSAQRRSELTIETRQRQKLAISVREQECELRAPLRCRSALEDVRSQA